MIRVPASLTATITMRFSVIYTALSATVANAAYSGDIVQYW